MRALSFVITAATGSGPLGSCGSGLAVPCSSACRSVSPHDSGLVFASGCTLMPAGSGFGGGTQRGSGKRGGVAGVGKGAGRGRGEISGGAGSFKKKKKKERIRSITKLIEIVIFCIMVEW